MEGKNGVSMNLNLLNEKTAFEKFEETLKVSIFGVLYVLLKNQDFSVWVEIIFVILQLLQFMAFPFRPMFASVWKQEETYTQVSNFLQYFQIVVFFQDNTEMYLIAFYICICLIILVIINIVYVSISFSRNKFNVMWPLRVLRSVLSFLVTVLFLPIFELFISVFNCVDPSTIPDTSTTTSTTTPTETNPALRLLQSSGSTVNSFAPTMTCWSGAHYVHAVFSIVVSIAFVIICTVVQMTYYETKSSTHNQSAKSSSRSDVFMLVCKIITILFFGFFGQKSSEWILTIVIFFLSGFMFISYYEERPYYSDKIMKAYLVSAGIYFWNCAVLLIGKILESSSFNGSLALFLLGIPIIIATILTNYDDKLTILLTNINKFQKGEKVQKQISYFLELVDKKDFDRNSKVLLKGYIYLFEESCTFEDCALKKYIYSMENNMDTVAFLLQHAESLYQSGISKFPNCTSLRISYAFFLIERMNKKQQANLELLNTEKYSPKFEEQFIIYRYKKLIEEQSNELTDSDDNLDVVSNIAYKNHLNQFKNCISKVATLYMDFWSLLLNPNQDNNEDLSKLNDYGSKINVLVEEINTHFDKMQKLKHNDQEVIRYYSDFLYDILNDKEKAAQYKTRLNEIEGSKQTYDEANLQNIDINALQSSDEYQYVILSAQPEKFGIITNLSLGICGMFGYSKNELIGKNIDIIMPEIFHKPHRNALQDKINELKKASLNVQNMRNFKPNFKDVNSFGKNKSRYLVPFNFKVTLIPNNDQNDSFFLAKISQDIFNLGNNHSQQVCYILTNNSFIIQNFTANSINFLGMNSSAMNNGNMEITRYIKEFKEECLKFNMDLEERTPEQLLAIKRHVSNKFKNSTPITWTKADENNPNNGLKRSIGIDVGYTVEKLDFGTRTPYDSNPITKDKSKPDNKFLMNKMTEDGMMLTIQDVAFKGKQEGYIFKFEVNFNNPTKETRDFKDVKDKETPTPLDKESIITADSVIGNLNVNVELSKQLSITSPKRNIDKKDRNLLDDPIRIDKDFVPENKWIFQLDPKKMSYMVNPNQKNLNDLKEVIKEEANKKMKENKSERTITDEEEESEYSDQPSDSQVSGSYYTESSVTVSEKSNSNRKNDEYYKISFTNMKFLIFDFKKNNVVEVIEWEKESQVELKKSDDYRRKEPGEMKTEATGGEKEIADAGEEEALADNSGKEGILIKQIEYALNKEENQPTITKMKWISFFVFLIYLGIAVIFLIFFLDTLKAVTENMNLVYNSYDILQNIIYGVYHTRELVLLNNPKYTNIYQTREDYIKNNTDTILDLFSSSHDLLTSVITTSLTFSTETDVIINNHTIFTSILQDDLTIKSFNLTLSSSFIETNTAIYHIAHLPISDILPTNKDVFFYLYNAINDLMLTLMKHAVLYINELFNHSESYKLLFLLIFLAALVFSIIAFIFIYMAYLAVEKRKESYLEVFFEIGGNVIKTSLEKCEYFSKKIQSESMSDAVSNLDEAELIHETTIQTVNTTVKKSSSGKKRKTNNSKEARVIMVKVLLGLLFFNGFFFAVYFVYKSYLGNVENYSEIYSNLCLEQSQYLMIFNTLREYFFDRYSNVNREVVNDFLTTQLNDIYSFKLERETNTSKYQSYFPQEYLDLFNEITNKDICPYSVNFFELYLPELQCVNFVSNSSSFGLDILLTNYVEEIRYAKNKFDLMKNSADQFGFTYNNTLHKHAKDPSLNTPEYKEHDPFAIFNDPVHLNLLILNRYFIRPAYLALKNQLKTSINTSLDTFQTIYIVVFAVFLALLVIIYLFVWRPFENSLNQTIYKTKNMLSIIPKEVLASLSNIHKLLDIGQNYSKGKRTMKS